MPEWAATIDRLIESGIELRAMCTERDCGGYWDVDLHAVREKLGGDYCIWNKHTSCRITPGCPGYNRFHHNRSLGFFGQMWDED